MVGQHGVCIDEVDQLLRRIFVDLYRIGRQSVRASVESYSIKKIEELFNFRRAAPARDSVLALQAIAAALALGDSHHVPAHLESPRSTTATMAGRICFFPTTRNPTSCITTMPTERLLKGLSSPG
jgi:hypothetical protein